jgi:hypothetical protein
MESISFIAGALPSMMKTDLPFSSWPVTTRLVF